MVRGVFALIVAGAVSACGTLGGPFDSDIGGEVVESPPVEQFRGPPVVQLTFLTGIDPSIEGTFLLDYVGVSIEETPKQQDDFELPDFKVARTNMNAMIAKNVFYAIHLAKYLKLKANSDFVVILNPVMLKYDLAHGYYYQPFETNLPPADLDLDFLAYVHPGTLPSTRGDVLTTYGETLAPVVSIRMDPVFNPDLGGAVAMTDTVMPAAQDPDGRGMRSQLLDYLNVERYGKTGVDYSKKAATSGAFHPGMLYKLSMKTFTLEDKPPAEDLVPASVLKQAKYEPGGYYAYEFYEGYYRIIMSALQSVDNRVSPTKMQRDYWSYYESPDALQSVMLQRTDRRKYNLMLKFKKAELDYLQDRDDNWINAVLETANFRTSFNKLRNAEQDARNDYINAQIEKGIGIALAILGGVAAGYGASQGDPYSTVAGGAAVGVGIAMVTQAVAELEQVDTAFMASFGASYESQKAYVIETAEGERMEVRAPSFGKFKERLKTRYDQRFAPRSPVPSNTTTKNAAVPIS